MSLLLRQRITDPASGIRAFRTIVTRTVKLEQTQYQTSELLIATAMNGFKSRRGRDDDARPPRGRDAHEEGPEPALRDAVRAGDLVDVPARVEAEAAALRSDKAPGSAVVLIRGPRPIRRPTA